MSDFKKSLSLRGGVQLSYSSFGTKIFSQGIELEKTENILTSPKDDYALLFTFVALFIFIGNMQKISFFNSFLLDFVSGKEVFTAIASSQIISNVPSALLLSGFTDKYDALLVGVNLGGLGTLIASMASLISYKYVIKEANELRGKYILKFTIYNIVFLLILVLFEIFL